MEVLTAKIVLLEQNQRHATLNDRGLGFPIFGLIFVWEAPIETRILDRYSSTGAKVRVKWIYYVTVAGEE